MTYISIIKRKNWKKNSLSKIKFNISGLYSKSQNESHWRRLKQKLSELIFSEMPWKYSFLALDWSFLRFCQNKKIGTVTWIISDSFCWFFFASDDYSFFTLAILNLMLLMLYFFPLFSFDFRNVRPRALITVLDDLAT